MAFSPPLKSLAAALWMLTLLLAAGCRDARDSVAAGGVAPHAAEAPAHLELVSEVEGATSATLRMRLSPAAAALPTLPPTLAFCLPAGRTVRAQWSLVSWQGKPLALAGVDPFAALPSPPPAAPKPGETPALPREAGNVEFIGYLRRWPVYRWTMPVGALDAIRKLAPSEARQHGPLELTLTLDWRDSAASPPAPAPPLLPSPPASQASAAASAGEKAWRDVAERFVFNHAGLDRFAVAAPPPPRDAAPRVTDPRLLLPAAKVWGRMEVNRDDFYRLDPDELVKAGFPATAIAPESIRIFTHGEPVPVIAAERAAAAGLPRGAYFWGRAGDGPYSATRTYWVTLGDAGTSHPMQLADLPASAAPPRRAATIQRDAIRDHDQTLENRTNSFLAIQGMTWVDGEVTTETPIEAPFTLPHYVATGRPLRLKLNFFISGTALTSPTRVLVRAGNIALGNVTLSHYADIERSLTLPPTAIVDGRCTLTLVALNKRPPWPETSDEPEPLLWFDRAAITYDAQPRLLDGRMTIASDATTSGTFWTPLEDLAGASDASRAIAIQTAKAPRDVRMWPIERAGEWGLRWPAGAGGSIRVFDVASIAAAPPVSMATFDTLADENQGADMLIVTHREFRPAAERLAAFHRERGLRVRVADVQAAFDTFSDGESSPLAIRSLLAYTLNHWKQGAPAWALLVGDCDSDYLGVARNGVRNWVPTYTYNNGGDQWASDYYLAMTAGDDDLADFMLGRISVANTRDADAVADKIIAYAGHPQAGPWRADLGFVADDLEFPETVDALRREDTPAAFGARRVFLNEMPLEDNWYLDADLVRRKHYKVSSAATQAILDTFKNGVAYLTYYGHGSPNIWADERIWFGGDTINSDNLHLAGTGRMAFVANMTCNSGAIDYPKNRWNICITEDLMRVPDGGAIACYVPSGPGVTSIHRKMSEALHEVMFTDGVRNFGELTTLAKLRYALQRQPREMLLMYLLLGDPAADLQMTRRWLTADLPGAAAAPGSTLKVPLVAIQPRQGRWFGELVGDDGKTIWRSQPAEYDGGAIALAAPIPADAAAGPAHVRVYAWNESSGDDSAIGAQLKIERPRLEIASLAADGPSSASLPAHGVRAEIVNPTGLVARGALDFILFDGDTSRTLSTAPLEIAPHGRLDLRQKLEPSSKPAQPQVIQARLTLAEPPDDPGQGAQTSRRLLVALPERWTGVVAALSGVDRKPATRTADISLAVATTDAVRDVEVGLLTAREESLLKKPLFLQQHANWRSGALDTPIAAEVLTRLQGGSVRVTAAAAPGSAPASAGGAVLGTLPVAALTERAPHLRLVPGSMRVHPEHPSDGETIFIDCAVENIGAIDSEPAMVGIFDKPQQQGGQRLSSPETPEWARAPRLPGRRAPLHLRWDPMDNAGEKTIWAQIVSEFGVDRALDPELSQSVKVEVRTKVKLAIGKVSAAQSDEDARANRVTISAEILNQGQTDARGVMVTFYRGAEFDDANQVGETALDAVPGLGSRTAKIVWSFDAAKDFVGGRLPMPQIAVWLKGSSQRTQQAPAASPAPALGR